MPLDDVDFTIQHALSQKKKREKIKTFLKIKCFIAVLKHKTGVYFFQTIMFQFYVMQIYNHVSKQ